MCHHWTDRQVDTYHRESKSADHHGAEASAEASAAEEMKGEIVRYNFQFDIRSYVFLPFAFSFLYHPIRCFLCLHCTAHTHREQDDGSIGRLMPRARNSARMTDSHMFGIAEVTNWPAETCAERCEEP